MTTIAKYLILHFLNHLNANKYPTKDIKPFECKFSTRSESLHTKTTKRKMATIYILIATCLKITRHILQDAGKNILRLKLDQLLPNGRNLSRTVDMFIQPFAECSCWTLEQLSPAGQSICPVQLLDIVVKLLLLIPTYFAHTCSIFS